jgi:hypothetical protein
MFSCGGMQRAKQGRLSSAPPDERLNGELCWRKENGSAACVVCKANCRKKHQFLCAKCIFFTVPQQIIKHSHLKFIYIHKTCFVCVKHKVQATLNYSRAD